MKINTKLLALSSILPITAVALIPALTSCSANETVLYDNNDAELYLINHQDRLNKTDDAWNSTYFTNNFMDVASYQNIINVFVLSFAGDTGPFGSFSNQNYTERTLSINNSNSEQPVINFGGKVVSETGTVTFEEHSTTTFNISSVTEDDITVRTINGSVQIAEQSMGGMISNNGVSFKIKSVYNTSGTTTINGRTCHYPMFTCDIKASNSSA
jgi:hypothetical protein